MNTPGSPLAARGRKLAGVLAAALVGWLMGSPAALAQIVWTGATSGNWGDGTNWSGGVVPNSSTAVANLTSTVGQSSTITVNGTISLGEIAFNATNSAAFTITGNALDLFGTPSSQFTAIADRSTNVETIASNIAVENTQQWLQSASTGNLVVSGAIDLGNLALTVNVANSTLISGLISDTGNLTKTGAGTLTLSNANNSYSGNTTISSGTLSIASDGDLGNTGATLNVFGGTLLATGNFSTSRNIVASSGTISTSANTTLTINSNISSTFSLQGFTKTGTGTLMLNGNNTYNGTTISAGTLVVANASNLGLATGDLTLNGGTLDTTANMTLAQTVTIGNLSATISASNGTTLAVTGNFGGNGTVTIKGNITLSGNDFDSGSVTTDVTNGSVLQAGTTNIIKGNITLSKTGTFDSNGYNQNVAALSGSGNILLESDILSVGGSLSISIAGNIDYIPFSGNISGSGGSLNFAGFSANLTLNGTNTYTGGTVVSSGNLIAGSANALPNTGVVSVQGGNLESTSTVTIGGLQIISGCVSSSGSGTFTSLTAVDAQNGTINGILSGAAGLTKSTTGIVTLNGTNTYSGDTDLNAGLLINNSTLALQNSTLNLNGGSFLFGYDLSSSTLGGLTGSQNMDLDSPFTIVAEFSRLDYYGPNGIALTIGQNNQNTTYNGNFTGAGSISKTGSGTLTLGGVGTFTGNTTIKAGTLALANPLAIEDSILVYNSGGGILSFGTLTSATLGGLSGNQNLDLDNSSDVAVALTVGNNNRSTTYSGNLTGAGSLTTSSLQTLTLAGTNTYTGNTTVIGGTLALNFSQIGAPANNIINSASQLSIDGTLNIIGSNSTTDTQTLAATILSPSASIFSLNGNNSIVNLNLGTLTRDTGATVNLVTNGNSTFSFLASSGSANSILLSGSTPYATINGSDWAAKNSTNTAIVGLSTVNGYTSSTASTLAGPNADIAVGISATLLSANDSLTSLRFNQNQTTTVNLGGHVLTVGGVLQTSAVAGSVTSSITNGMLKSATPAGDLVILQNSAQPLVIGASIVDNGGATGLTVAGSGQVQLNGNNTYTGATTVSGGTLSLGANNILSSSANVAVSGGTLDLGSSSQSINYLVLTNGNIIGPTATLTSNAYNVQNGSISTNLSGNGSLTKTTGGIVTLSGNNTFSGTTILLDGTLALSSSQALQNSTVNLLGGCLTFSTINTTYYLGSLNSSQNILTGTDRTPDIQVNVGGNNQDSTYSGDFSGSGSLAKSGTSNLTLTGNNTFYGNLTVTGGNLIVSGPNAAVINADFIAVATNGSANLTITNGASLGSNISEEFAQSTGSSANITVTGSNSTLYGNLILGDAGSANLTVSNGGSVVSVGVTLGNSTGGSGNIVVAGANSKLTDILDGDSFWIGINGSGSLSVLNGATVTSAYGLTIGGATPTPDATATMTVDGQNSVYNGSVVMNYGTLTVSNGGIIYGAGAAIGGTTLITDPGSAWINNFNAIDITGCMTVANGGLFEMTTTNLSGNGNLTVTGANSSMTGSVFINTATAQIDILNGGNYSGSIGPSGYSTTGGIIIVSGNGSTWNSPGGVGIGSNGTLIISNGGIANMDTSSSQDVTYSTNITGTAIVTGAGSSWQANSLIMGASQYSTGNLSILNGGVVSGSGNIAVDLTSNDYVIVDGIGSQWNSPTLFLGYSGDGYLTVSNGGSVVSSNLTIGQGFLTVSNGSSLAVSNLTIGQNPDSGIPNVGTGIVTQTGGTVTIGGQLAWGSNNSTYNLDGGVLQIGGIDGLIGSSNYTFNLAGGTVQVFGSDLTTCVNATLGDTTTSTIDTNGMNATWMGALSGNGSLDKIGNGTLTLAGSNSYAGSTTVNAGTLSVTGSLAGGNNLTLGANTTFQVGGTGTIAQGNVSLGGATNLTVNGLAQYSQITVASLLNYGGNLSLSLGNALNYGIYNLFASGSTVGDFLNIALTGLFSTALSDSSGVWSGTVSSQNFSFNDATGSLSVSGNNSSVASPSRQTWLDSNFSILQMADPSISGDTASPAGDGIPNLLKYALNLNPWLDGHAGLPQPCTDGTNLILAFTEYESDVTYTVEASTDLVTWSTTGVTVQTNGNQVTANYPLPINGTAFMRLVVTPSQ